jgi:hypothetical protein
MLAAQAVIGLSILIIGFESENSSYVIRSGCSFCIHSAIGGLASARTNGCAKVR